MAENLIEIGDARIQMAGQTGGIDSRQPNLALIHARAEAVRERLAGLGVPRANFAVLAGGDNVAKGSFSRPA